MNPAKSSARTRLIAFSCFFLSGSTGLLYEVVWTRLLGAVIGNTHFSITLVVSVFMGGLALGSYFGGRLADRSRNPLRLYGIVTLFVGLSCLLVPLLLAAARPFLGWLYRLHDGEPEAPVLLAANVVVCSLSLLVPTSFMGATLPALSRHFARRFESVGGTVGALYALNTLGAVAGAIFTGFLGVWLLGIWYCIALAVIVDVVIAAAVILASRGETLPAAATGTPAVDKHAPASIPRQKSVAPASPGLLPNADRGLPIDARLAVFAFGAVGFIDMLLQIAWTKAIVQSIGNSTYAFSLIVSLFILGIALGGGMISFLVDRWKNHLLVLGVLILATAALVSATVPILGYLPIVASRLFDRIQNPGYDKFLSVQIALVSMVILPSTVLMGTVFPIVGKIRTRAVEQVGSAIGSAYFWNTLGSILGTLAAGFLFIPLFGRVYYTLYLGVGLSLLVGAVLIVRALRPVGPIGWAAVAGLLVLIVVPGFFFRPHGVLGATGPLWHPAIMSRGAYVYYEGTYRDRDGKVIPVRSLIDGLIAQNKVLYYKEGIHAPVAVVQGLHGEVAMRISGKVEASMSPTGGLNTDMPHQILAGHLPMVLHPDPKDVLTLGLGGGVTLGTLTVHPVKSIDSLEISPEVIEAARDYFGSANRGAIVNPLVRNVIGDGRTHLEYTTRTYDVITSVPSNPWIAGIGNLFTVEFFRTCRERLRRDGILCNWIHKINMRVDDFRTVVRTFVAVFDEHAQLWDLGYDALLIGGTSPVRFDAARFLRLLEIPQIAADLKILGITSPETFLRHFLMDVKQMQAYVASRTGPWNRDAFPVLEFSCPYGLYGHPYDAFRSLALAERTEIPESWAQDAGPILDRARKVQSAFQLYLRVQARVPLLAEAMQKQSPQSREPRPAEVRQLAEALVDDLKSIEAMLRGGVDPWLEQQASAVAARALPAPQGPTLASTIAAYMLQIARAARKADNPAECLSALEQVGPYLGESAAAVKEYSLLWVELGQPRRGLETVVPLASRNPDSADHAQALGVLQAANGQLQEAVATLARALSLAKDARLRSEILQNTGYTFQVAGKLEEALREYEKALQENPENSLARSLRDQVRKALGQ